MATTMTASTIKTVMALCVVGLAAIGCGSDATAPSANLATERTREVQRFEFVDELFLVSECVGEPTEFHLRERVTFTFQVLPNGQRKQTEQILEQGSTGIGLVTGRQWKAVGNQKFSFSGPPSVVHPDGTITGTTIGRGHTALTFISPGSATLHLGIQFSFLQTEFFDPSTGESDTNIIKESFRQRVTGCQ